MVSYRKYFFEIAFALITSRFPIDPMNINYELALNINHSFSAGHREIIKLFIDIVQQKRKSLC